jgi:hypothetical protein
MAVLATRRERALHLRKVARAAGGLRGLQRLRETEAELAAQRERNQYLETELASAEARLATLEQQAAEVCRASHASPHALCASPTPSRPPPIPPTRNTGGGWLQLTTWTSMRCALQDEQDLENMMAECELQMQVRFRRRLELHLKRLLKVAQAWHGLCATEGW